jgi:hypothetical protein
LCTLEISSFIKKNRKRKIKTVLEKIVFLFD